MLVVLEKEYRVNFVVLEMQDFTSFFGVTWLSLYHTSILRHKKKLIFKIPTHPDFVLRVIKLYKPPQVFVIQAHQMLRNGRPEFLTSIRDLTQKRLPYERFMFCVNPRHLYTRTSMDATSL